MQCIAALSNFQLDMMGKVKVNTLVLIDEDARLILWETGPICVLNAEFAPVVLQIKEGVITHPP